MGACAGCKPLGGNMPEPLKLPTSDVYISPREVWVMWQEKVEGAPRPEVKKGVVLQYVWAVEYMRTGPSQGCVKAVILSEAGDQLLSKEFGEIRVCKPPAGVTDAS